MNLFIESLAGYLIREWDRTLNIMDGPREARFIVQSLDPLGTLALFRALDAHRLAWLQKQSITCHFRVATTLWRDWTDATPSETQSKKAIERTRSSYSSYWSRSALRTPPSSFTFSSRRPACAW